MGKRIFLFLVTNLAIVLTLSIVMSVLGVGNYVGPEGLNLGALATLCLLWGMGGAFISLQMSRWIAKRATGVQLVDGRTGASELDWLYATVERLTRQANLPMPEVGVYDSGEVNAFATGPSKSRSLVAVSSGLMRVDAAGRDRGCARARSGAHRQRRHGHDDAAAGRDQRVRDVPGSHHRALRDALRRRAMAAGCSFVVMIVLQIGLGILGSLITAWYSRQREFRADYGGATLAGKPNMLGALRRLAANREAVDTSHQALATLKINGTRGWMVFFSTHPPLEQRIAALERAQI